MNSSTPHDASRPPLSHEGHEAAVLDAEVGMVLDQLRKYGGTLTREALAEHTDADLWHRGTLDEALAAGAERGVITVVPGGLVQLSE
jgi:hypothetical protein